MNARHALALGVGVMLVGCSRETSTPSNPMQPAIDEYTHLAALLAPVADEASYEHAKPALQQAVGERRARLKAVHERIRQFSELEQDAYLHQRDEWKSKPEYAELRAAVERYAIQFQRLKAKPKLFAALIAEVDPPTAIPGNDDSIPPFLW